jgi:ABC-type polysaccharide/polyol phosphate export permease
MPLNFTKQPYETTPIYDTTQRGSLALEEIRQALRYRDLFLELVRRNILIRYKRSLLGIAWAMLNPLGMMIILTIVFSHVFLSIQGYPVYILSGLIAWNFFAQSAGAAIDQLIWSGSLLQRIYAPKTTFAISAIGTGLVNLVLSLAPLILVMLAIAVPIRPAIVFLPVPILLLVCFTLGIGLLISAIAIFFPDIIDIYQIVMTAWMYLTPIFYPIEILPAEVRLWVTSLNPMYYLVQLFRIPIYEGRLPDWAELWPTGLFSLATLLLGWLVFTNKADQLAYRS